MPAAKIDRVQATLHASNNVLRRVVAGQHVRVGHPRHGNLLIALPPPVAGARNPHQPRAQLVAEIALQDAVFDQHRLLGRRAFVVHVEGSAPRRHPPVVYNGHLAARHPLPHESRKRRRLLPVEVCLQTVPHRLMQQNAGPSRTQHHFHLARRRRHRAQLQNRRPCGLRRKMLRTLRAGEGLNLHAPAAAGAAPGHALAVLRDHEHAHPRQRLCVAGIRSIGSRNQNPPQLIGIARPHLRDARIVGPRRAIRPPHQLQLHRQIRIQIRCRRRIQTRRLRLREAMHRLLRRPARNQRRGARRS